MNRAASATHGSPDVIGHWRGHDLRTHFAAYLEPQENVRYRESCRPRQSLRGNGCGPRTKLQTWFKPSTRPRYGGALVMSAGIRTPAIQMSHCREIRATSEKCLVFRWCRHIASGNLPSMT